MRPDRTLSLYLFGPFSRLLARRGRRIPILMYHRVPDVDVCSVHPYYCTSTAAPVFSDQMRFLHRNGYRTVTIAEAYQEARKDASDEKVVAITFDDGYHDFYTSAFPVLRRYGHSATVFLPTAYIGDSPHQFKGEKCLTWRQIRELRKAGVAFGSHTVTHPQLREIDRDRVREEVSASKSRIEEKLGEPVTAFSYPYAFPEADRNFLVMLRGVLQESGYEQGVSTIIGRVDKSSDPFFMKRLPVNSHDDAGLLGAKLDGGYDWLHVAQYVAKQTTRRSPVVRQLRSAIGN